MLCIIKIGYMEYLLPNETGLATILKALSKAVEVKLDNRYKREGFVLGEAPEVSSEMLPNYKLVSRPSREPVLEPEVLPPIHQAARLPESVRRSLPQGRLLIGDGV